MAHIIINIQHDRVNLPGVILQRCSEFLGMERVNTAVVGSCAYQHHRKVDPAADMLVG